MKKKIYILNLTHFSLKGFVGVISSNFLFKVNLQTLYPENTVPKLTLDPFLTLSVINGSILQSFIFQAFIYPSRVDITSTVSLKMTATKLILNYFQLNVMNRTSNIDLENYVPNGEWELLEARLVRTEQYYPCCIEPYPSMTVSIR